MFLAIFVVKVLLVPTIKKSKKILTAKVAKEAAKDAKPGILSISDRCPWLDSRESS